MYSMFHTPSCSSSRDCHVCRLIIFCLTLLFYFAFNHKLKMFNMRTLVANNILPFSASLSNCFIWWTMEIFGSVGPFSAGWGIKSVHLGSSISFAIHTIVFKLISFIRNVSIERLKYNHRIFIFYIICNWLVHII